MYSVIAGIYAIVFLIEAVLLVYIGSQRRSLRAYFGALLGVIGFALVVMPDSTFFSWVASVFGEAAPYVASVLFARSKVGLVSYGVLILLVGFIGGIWELAPTSKKPANKKRRG